MRRHKGFTLIELLVVISIISLLTMVVLASLSNARNRAKIAKARSELNNIASAVMLLVDNTGRLPSSSSTKTIESSCTAHGEEVVLTADSAGINNTDGAFPGWNGPYMKVPSDPWGNAYTYDDDYNCSAAPTALGCANYGGNNNLRAVYSPGPNGSGINVYDSDNIIRVLCSHQAL